MSNSPFSIDTQHTKIGFELEMSFPKSTSFYPSTPATYHPDDFFQALIDTLGDEYPDIHWKKYLRYTLDASIVCKKNHLELELITEPLPITQALALKQVLSQFLVKHGAHTNSSCGLHVNISNPAVTNYPALALHLCQHLPIEEIKTQLGRTHSTACKHNFLNQIDLNDFDIDIAQRLKSYRSNVFDRNLRKLDVQDLFNLTQSPAASKASAFQSIVFSQATELLTKQWAQKRPAIAPRKEYLEFRFLGGANYLTSPFVSICLSKILKQFHTQAPTFSLDSPATSFKTFDPKIK